MGVDDLYLIKRAEIEKLPGVQKVHFLNPNAKRSQKSLGELTGLSGFAFYLITVAPGFESTEYHRHHHEDYCAYILCGAGVVVVGGEEYDIGPGDFIGYRAGGKPHTMRATGCEPLRCIVVGQCLPYEIVDYPMCQRRTYTKAGLPPHVVMYDPTDDNG